MQGNKASSSSLSLLVRPCHGAALPQAQWWFSTKMSAGSSVWEMGWSQSVLGFKLFWGSKDRCISCSFLHSNDPWKPNQTSGFNTWFLRSPPKVALLCVPSGLWKAFGGEGRWNKHIAWKSQQRLRMVTFDGLEWSDLASGPPLLGTGPGSAPRTCIFAPCCLSH